MAEPPLSREALAALAAELAALPGLRGKADIRPAAAALPHHPFPGLGPAAALGDDAALLPGVGGPLLLAAEGLAPALVADDPWFAGWCGVLVNLSDIAAMGGRPLALVDSLWSPDHAHAEQVLAGLRSAADRFGVPLVGGHSNLNSPYAALSVAVLGMAPGPVLSARSARPGDRCVLLVNRQGAFHRHYPFWDGATGADAASLRRHLALLPELAATGAVHAAKDISMGGLAGTAVMFAEAAGCALELDLERIEPPPGVPLARWLACFPSTGFLLATQPGRLDQLLAQLAGQSELHAAVIGRFSPGGGVSLASGGSRARLWHPGTHLTGFGATGSGDGSSDGA